MNRFFMICCALGLIGLTTGCVDGFQLPVPTYQGDDDTSDPDAIDADGDGFDESEDCNDRDASINPDADEICDGLDNDCSGVIDDGQNWWLDYDGDTYGDADFYYEGTCDDFDASEYLVDNDEDCDDNDAEVNPGAEEVCDGLDNDCSGEVDDNATDAVEWFADADGDGYGTEDDILESCDQPEGYAAEAGDCDDANTWVNPSAEEVCNEVDDDCDGETDEDVQTEWYADGDGDGYGNESDSVLACDEAPSGYVAEAGDCDDEDASAYPDAEEVCDEVDNDCDGEADEDDATDATTWYADADGDGHGDDSDQLTECVQPEGYIETSGDCDDSDADVNPDATEVCNDIDDDCDGVVDPSTAADVIDWYVDADGDSEGDASGTAVTQCDQPSGYVADSSDCDDSDADVNTSATEVCDEVDNDCDGDIDPDDSADVVTWYLDEDEDGYGDSIDSVVSCEAPSGYVDNDDDCDDNDNDNYLGATEVCDDGEDNDCDGDVDSDDLCYYEGTYEGSFDILLTETLYDFGEDTCSGTASIVIDATADPVIDGTGECSFIGDFVLVLPDTYVSTLSGSFVDSDLSSEGTAETPDLGWSLDWTNAWTAEDEFDMYVSGSDTYMGFEFDYELTVVTDLQ